MGVTLQRFGRPTFPQAAPTLSAIPGLLTPPEVSGFVRDVQPQQQLPLAALGDISRFQPQQQFGPLQNIISQLTAASQTAGQLPGNVTAGLGQLGAAPLGGQAQSTLEQLLQTGAPINTQAAGQAATAQARSLLEDALNQTQEALGARGLGSSSARVAAAGRAGERFSTNLGAQLAQMDLAAQEAAAGRRLGALNPALGAAGLQRGALTDLGQLSLAAGAQGIGALGQAGGLAGQLGQLGLGASGQTLQSLLGAGNLSQALSDQSLRANQARAGLGIDFLRAQPAAGSNAFSGPSGLATRTIPAPLQAAIPRAAPIDYAGQQARARYGQFLSQPASAGSQVFGGPLGSQFASSFLDFLGPQQVGANLRQSAALQFPFGSAISAAGNVFNQRQEGGPSGPGGTFQLHEGELVVPKDMVEELLDTNSGKEALDLVSRMRKLLLQGPEANGDANFGESSVPGFQAGGLVDPFDFLRSLPGLGASPEQEEDILRQAAEILGRPPGVEAFPQAPDIIRQGPFPTGGPPGSTARELGEAFRTAALAPLAGIAGPAEAVLGAGREFVGGLAGQAPARRPTAASRAQQPEAPPQAPPEQKVKTPSGGSVNIERDKGGRIKNVSLTGNVSDEELSQALEVTDVQRVMRAIGVGPKAPGAFSTPGIRRTPEEQAAFERQEATSQERTRLNQRDIERLRAQQFLEGALRRGDVQSALVAQRAIDSIRQEETGERQAQIAAGGAQAAAQTQAIGGIQEAEIKAAEDRAKRLQEALGKNPTADSLNEALKQLPAIAKEPNVPEALKRGIYAAVANGLKAVHGVQLTPEEIEKMLGAGLFGGPSVTQVAPTAPLPSPARTAAAERLAGLGLLPGQ